MSRALDITGHIYGKLTVVDFSHRDKRKIAHWRCYCSCGAQAVVAQNNLRSGNSTTCGCRHGILVSDPITQDQLKQFLTYSPEIGVFAWLVSGRNFAIGQVAGHTNDANPYVRISIERQSYYAHVLAWLYMTGSWPAEEIDHKDQNVRNNRWLNLRAASHAQNGANKSSYSKLGLKGVTRVRSENRYAAKITVGGRGIYLGYFSSAEAAARAYDAKAREVFGEFACTNYGDC